METINHECYVSLEVAKLLKQAGFDWECRRVYCNWGSFTNDGCIEDNEVGLCNWNSSGIAEQYSAPTLDVAQRWLRGVKGYNVLVCHDFKLNKHAWLILQDNDALCHDETRFDTYEEAQEAGEKNALELILEKGE